MARGGERRRRAAAGTRDRVEVDVVRHLRGRVVVEVKLDEVALAHADEGPGHVAAVGPEEVLDAVGEPLDDLADLEVDDDLGRVTARDRRRHVRRLGEDGELDGQVGGERGRALFGGDGALGRKGRGQQRRSQQGRGGESGL